MEDVADENSQMQTHWVGSGRVLSTGASVPVELGCVTLPVRACVYPPGSPWTLYYCDCIEPSSPRHIQLLIPFLAPLPSLKGWRVGGGGCRPENSRLLIVAFGLPGDQPPGRSPPRVASSLSGTKDIPGGLSLGIYKVFWSSVPRPSISQSTNSLEFVPRVTVTFTIEKGSYCHQRPTSLVFESYPLSSLKDLLPMTKVCVPSGPFHSLKQHLYCEIHIQKDKYAVHTQFKEH